MKKLLILIVLGTGWFSAFAQNQDGILQSIRFDLNGSVVVPSSLSSAIGPGLGFGFASRDLDVMLLTRMAMYDMDTISPRQFYQGLLRADIKFPLPDSPLVILGGIGVGASYGLDLPKTSVPGNERFAGIAPSFELSTGVLFPLNQTISAIGRIGYAMNNFRIDEFNSLKYSGFLTEIGIRFALGNTVPLQY